MFNLSNHVVVITGASSGLGKQMSRAFAAQGANLAVLARRVERLEELKADLEKTYKVKVLPVKCDVTSTEDIDAAAAAVEQEYGKVDVLVNVAGSSKDKGVLDMQDDEWDFTLATDLTSVFKMTRAFANIMMKNPMTPHGRGRIINIASMYGLMGNTQMGTIAYHASKGGVVNFTRGVAGELSKEGITCNAICPGYFETELTKPVLDTKEFQAYMAATVPMQRYGHEGELNAGAIFLASDEASYVSGAILPIDGGWSAAK